MIKRFCVSASALPLAAVLALATPDPSDPAAPILGDVCVASAEGIPSSLLVRVAGSVGQANPGGEVLRVRSHRASLQPYQSDRTYAPFFSAFGSFESWFSPATAVEREQGMGGGWPGNEIPKSRFPTLTSSSAQWVLRDTMMMAAPDFGFAAVTRPLNPWAVISDFQRSREVKAIGRCRYRDYQRIALTRPGPYGDDTLMIDGKTWTPVGLKRTEPHYLWGQVAVEYVWTNWDDISQGEGRFPLSAFRVVDGVTELSVTTTDAALLPADSAPAMLVPDTGLVLPSAISAFVRPQMPDTVRVAENAYLLVNRFYTTGAMLLRDTVFLLDATLSEGRARQDSTWVARLFPGRHPIVLVVTDLAWPHIGGVRFWVANGATVVTHQGAADFLAEVVNRRWTLEPDRLERERQRTRLTIRTLTDSLTLAGGDLVLHAIDGASSEVAIMGWMPRQRFLWPGDYIQNTREPSGYAREVLRATRRARIVPDRFAAQHVGLTPWRVIDSLHPEEAPPAVDPATVDASPLRLGASHRRSSLIHDGQTQDRGPDNHVLTQVTRGGRKLLVSTRLFSTPSGPAIDSSIADAKTLIPLRHVGIHSSRTMVLEFSGSRVRGSYAVQNEPVRPIDHPMEARPFDSSLYDLVIASLPLAVGYRARVPFYVYEQGGLVWYDVAVTGREMLDLSDRTRADAWAVDVKEGDQLRSRLWVAAGPQREVLRSTFYFSGGEFISTR